jgi:hypothetical protein
MGGRLRGHQNGSSPATPAPSGHCLPHNAGRHVSKFVTRAEQEPTPESSEALFYALRRRDQSVSFLWSHQADMLRDYHRVADSDADVAIELPTGSGKTLVGLLVAEWRRRVRQERVIYLCPNKQLAVQVAERAEGYGIQTALLTGPWREWVPSEHTAYARAHSIAVATYSALFNTSPRLDDGQLLILDDAHAGEGPVASLWSLTATRDDGLYHGIVDVVREMLPAAFAQRLDEENVDPVERAVVELVGPHQLALVADQLREVLATQAEGEAEFRRQMVSDALERCLLYVSWRELLVRPLIPPTRFHAAFAAARQRVYLSATLGAGGELERAFGVRRINRLPVPVGWQEHGSGRRFFLFPDASLDEAQANAFTTASIDRVSRTLILAPSRHEATRAQQWIPPNAAIRGAVELEQDAAAAISQPGVFLLANRYDGLDLPDDACRLIVLTGLPSGTHLQERFLFERLGAQRVIAERVRTRIVQGAGRCTRNARDYAAVIVRGDRLQDFLTRNENVQPMQPDLQAEIEFGLDNSEQEGVDLSDLLDTFLAQEDEWLVADRDIRRRASMKQSIEQAGFGELTASAPHEVAAWEAAWRGDMQEAVDRAREAADQLGGPAVAPYRCLWLYLAASWALADATTDDGQVHASALVDDAEACARGLRWRPRFTGSDSRRTYSADFGPREERAAAVLIALGLKGMRFERRLREVHELLGQRRADPFERGLEHLGELLGFESIRPTGNAQPDGAWRDEGRWIVFEAKTEPLPTAPIPASDVRQALSHPDWLQHQHGWPAPQYVVNCLVTEREAVAPDAAAIAQSLCRVHPDVVREIEEATMRVLRQVRSSAPGLDDDGLAAALTGEFRQARLDTDTLMLRLGNQPVARMPRSR